MNSLRKCRRCKEKKPRNVFRYVSSYSWDYLLCPTCLPIVENYINERKKRQEQRIHYNTHPPQAIRSPYSHYFMVSGCLWYKESLIDVMVVFTNSRMIHEKMVKKAIKSFKFLDVNISPMDKWEFFQVENDVVIINSPRESLTMNMAFREYVYHLSQNTLNSL